MHTDTDISYFLSFCVEQYKAAHHLTGEQTIDLFAEYGVLKYLQKNFEVLHTQNHHWLVEEIDEFINDRRAQK